MKLILGSGRRHYGARAGICLIIVALIAGIVGCGRTPSEGLEIRTWYGLDAIRDNLSGDYTLMNDVDSTTPGYMELASPTANEGKGWQSIGTHNDPFTGTFDGQEYEIRDLCSDRPDEGYVGLFGHVDDRGIIGNLGVVNANVTRGAIVGSLAGFNGGTVSNSYSTGNIVGFMCVGGLVGINSGTVSNSYSTGSLTANYYQGFVGGLVGQNRGVVSNSYYNYDEVLINGENIITIGALFHEDFEEWLANDKFLDINGRLSKEDSYYVVSNVGDFKELLAFGQNTSLKFRLTNDLDLATEPNFYIPYLAGEFDGNDHQISNLSFNFRFASQVGLFGYLASDASVHDVAAESVNIAACVSVGGLLGFNAGTVGNSSSTGSVTGNVSVGGLAGASDGAMRYCHSTSSVIGTRLDAGGLVGANAGTLSNSYATGSVSGDKHVGGLTGGNYGDVSNSYSTCSVTGVYDVGGLVGLNTDYATVSNSYSTGNVTGSHNVGGLVGHNYDATVSNSFWDTETSGQAASDGGTGRTTSEMQDIATFSGAGWNISAVADSGTRNLSYIWNIADALTYPFLSWQP
ncbi:MAG: hypothetical protein JSW22_04775 [Chloroflexota bacterium]|nr:MAG: hypothetical protein JSW22_04775 [Chloroflexota bacterium]